MTLFDEKLGVFAVKTAALGLNIGTHGASDIGTLVVIKTALRHRAVYNVDSALNVALLIGVLNAQNELSAVVTRDQPGVQRRAQIADVHIARGAWSKSRAHLTLGYARLHLLEPCHIHK